MQNFSESKIRNKELLNLSTNLLKATKSKSYKDIKSSLHNLRARLEQ